MGSVRISFMAMRGMSKVATDPSLYFDTDCLSAFLWIKDESILTKLYPGRVVIPKQVYIELSKVPHLRARIDALISRGEVMIMELQAGTPEYNTYIELTAKPEPGHMAIGRGEAAAIALCKSKNGVVASNNLKDISRFISEYGLQHKTTGDILVEAFEAGLISEADGNVIWSNMLRKHRMIGAATFTDYLQTKRDDNT